MKGGNFKCMGAEMKISSLASVMLSPVGTLDFSILFFLHNKSGKLLGTNIQ